MTIVKYTTAYPFRLPDTNMLCLFCPNKFEDCAEFRDHMRNEHETFDDKVALRHIRNNEMYQKVDCTELHCRICGEAFARLPSVAAHLNEAHDMKVITDDLGLQEFQFRSESWSCAVCRLKFPSIRALSRHTASHYRNVVCYKCCKSFSTKSDLEKHTQKSHSNVICCDKCKNEFLSREDLSEHRRISMECWKYKCTVCVERFFDYKTKLRHMREKHGTVMSIKCTECPKTFKSTKSHRLHFALKHSGKYICSFCNRSFAEASKLRLHIAQHEEGEENKDGATVPTDEWHVPILG
ncbi:unnamed protein product [Plutella xylostella]|uniref:(diamondback moth) hypothetical protein n=1 Tax=Plutella xylostella TaxID=51655 RepID=A0A8S4DVM5_PLUXY|nr:unnamed protein product [Plutella xylostella]